MHTRDRRKVLSYIFSVASNIASFLPPIQFRTQRHSLISPPCTKPRRASPKRASVLYTINHARQCAIRMAKPRMRSMADSIARRSHRTDMVDLLPFFSFGLFAAGAVARSSPTTSSSFTSACASSCTSPPSSSVLLDALGGRTSHSLLVAWRCGKGGSHGLRVDAAIVSLSPPLVGV
jgi:hypothetical protein